MIRMAAAVLSFSVAVAVQAWEVESLFPSRGTVGGGDIVTVHTTYRPGGPCDPIPCGMFPHVKFGDVAARSAITDTQTGAVTIVTPAHAPGTVPVTIDFDGTPQVVGTFEFLDRHESFPYEIYEQVLVPVSIGGEPVPGAHGSRWTSELWVSNSGEHRVEVMHGLNLCSTCVGEPFPGLAPGETKKIELPAGGANAAYRLYVQRGGIDDLTFSLRIRDVGHSEDNHGTEIPVVRMEGAFDRFATVVNVPIDSRSRTGLRVFSSSAHVPEVEVRVDVYPVGGREKVASALMTLRNPAQTTELRPNHFEYAFAGDVRALFPALADGNYRLEIQATDPVYLHPLYALVSVTNNRTQLVTAIASE
jgi:hypothetical protein